MPVSRGIENPVAKGARLAFEEQPSRLTEIADKQEPEVLKVAKDFEDEEEGIKDLEKDIIAIETLRDETTDKEAGKKPVGVLEVNVELPPEETQPGSATAGSIDLVETQHAASEAPIEISSKVGLGLNPKPTVVSQESQAEVTPIKIGGADEKATPEVETGTRVEAEAEVTAVTVATATTEQPLAESGKQIKSIELQEQETSSAKSERPIKKTLEDLGAQILVKLEEYKDCDDAEKRKEIANETAMEVQEAEKVLNGEKLNEQTESIDLSILTRSILSKFDARLTISEEMKNIEERIGKKLNFGPIEELDNSEFGKILCKSLRGFDESMPESGNRLREFLVDFVESLLSLKFAEKTKN